MLCVCRLVTILLPGFVRSNVTHEGPLPAFGTGPDGLHCRAKHVALSPESASEWRHAASVQRDPLPRCAVKLRVFPIPRKQACTGMLHPVGFIVYYTKLTCVCFGIARPWTAL